MADDLQDPPPKTARQTTQGPPTAPVSTSPPTGPGEVPGVVLPTPVAPTPPTGATAQIYANGSYTRSSTTPTGGAAATTTKLDLTGGYRFVSNRDANGNGIADKQTSVYVYRRQDSGLNVSSTGLGAEYRVEPGGRFGDASIALKGEYGRTNGAGGGRDDWRVGVGISIPFGGGSKPSPMTESTERMRVLEDRQKAFDDALRTVYRSPDAVRSRVEGLDRGFNPAGQSFGQIVGVLQDPETLAGGANGLTRTGQTSDAAVQRTIDTYVGVKKAEIATIRSADPKAFDSVVRQQESLIKSFQDTFGKGWQGAYAEFRTAGTLPAGTQEPLLSGAPALLAYERSLLPSVAAASRDQAEMNQYLREVDLRKNGTEPTPQTRDTPPPTQTNTPPAQNPSQLPASTPPAPRPVGPEM